MPRCVREVVKVCCMWVYDPKVGFPVFQGKFFMTSLSSSNSITQIIVIYDNHNGCMVLVGHLKRKESQTFRRQKEEFTN